MKFTAKVAFCCRSAQCKILIKFAVKSGHEKIVVLDYTQKSRFSWCTTESRKEFG